MKTLWQDIKFSVRMMLKHRSFSFIAVSTLALGIGANAIIFSIVNGVLLNPLPIRDSDRIAVFWQTAPAKGITEMSLTDGLFDYYQKNNKVFETIAAYDGQDVNLTGIDNPKRLSGIRITSDYFRVFEEQPLYGRAFLPEETAGGNHRVVILSYELWQREFGGKDLINKTISLNDIPTTVVGIMPEGFNYPNRIEGGGYPERVALWIPLDITPESNTYWNYRGIGRLKQGVSVADAQRELSLHLNNFTQQQKIDLGAGSAAVVMRLKQKVVGDVRTTLLILLGTVGLVLLIACANITNLLLARATSRQRELAIRSCLGASSGTIVRQLLTESLMLALTGAGVGLVLAFWGLEVIKKATQTNIPRIEQVQINPVMLLFTLVVALLTGLLCGIAPALRSRKTDLHKEIKEGARGSASAYNRGLNSAFVVSQIALSLILLIGAGLLLQSFKKLLAVNPGFRPENILTATTSLPGARYKSSAQVYNFYDQLLGQVKTLPGVQSAALCNVVPFSGGGGGAEFSVEGISQSGPSKDAWWRSVSPDYFTTMGIPILKGRAFQTSDTDKSTAVAIIDEKIANTYWANENPLGKRIQIGGNGGNVKWLTIVGIVPGVKNRNLSENTKPYIYQPYSQLSRRDMSLVVRTANDPAPLTAAIRNKVSGMDSGLPLYNITTVEQNIDKSVSNKRFTNFLLTGFAATALLLTMIGIYGVMSLNVSNRINEFGIRLALGAKPVNVLRLVLANGLKLIIIGIGIGLVGAFALTRLMQSQLFGMSAQDPITFLFVSLILVAVALAACLIPAGKAARTDPIIALKYE